MATCSTPLVLCVPASTAAVSPVEITAHHFLTPDRRIGGNEGDYTHVWLEEAAVFPSAIVKSGASHELDAFGSPWSIDGMKAFSQVLKSDAKPAGSIELSFLVVS